LHRNKQAHRDEFSGQNKYLPSYLGSSTPGHPHTHDLQGTAPPCCVISSHCLVRPIPIPTRVPWLFYLYASHIYIYIYRHTFIAGVHTYHHKGFLDTSAFQALSGGFANQRHHQLTGRRRFRRHVSSTTQVRAQFGQQLNHRRSQDGDRLGSFQEQKANNGAQAHASKRPEARQKPTRPRSRALVRRARELSTVLHDVREAIHSSRRHASLLLRLLPPR
jgi:hypothetical protein